MKIKISKHFWVSVACLCLWPVLAFAQSSDLAQNLADCKSGTTCDRSKLTSAESVAVALADHARNVSDCRNGYDSCDRAKLSGRETTALAVADHQRNASDCNDGMPSCDRSKLTE